MGRVEHPVFVRVQDSNHDDDTHIRQKTNLILGKANAIKAASTDGISRQTSTISPLSEGTSQKQEERTRNEGGGISEHEDRIPTGKKCGKNCPCGRHSRERSGHCGKRTEGRCAERVGYVAR